METYEIDKILKAKMAEREDMEKLREIKKRLRNNKGFSLVELIIVIAIMAILVAILAPQFLKYVERSRNSGDVANAREMTNAIAAHAVDTETADVFKEGKVTVTVDGTHANIAVVSGSANDNTTAVYNAFKNAGITSQTDKANLTDIRCKSKTTWTNYVITVTVADDGTVTFKYNGPGDTGTVFAEAMQGTISKNSGTP